jgi:glycosyltransferase involved in cell wall biosynthesis
VGEAWFPPRRARRARARGAGDPLLRVLSFGTYQRDYPRNAQTIALLRKAGVSVVERHEPVWEGRRDAWRAGAPAALRLARAELRLARRLHGEFDAVLVGYPGHLDVLALRRALPEGPLIFNPLVSLSDTLVGDRARFGAGSLPARTLRAVDRRAFATADVVVADTHAHAELFSSLGAREVEVVPIGAEERIFHPSWQPAAERRVLFVGKLIPLHGVETILGAAAALPNVRFRVIGEGQLDDLLRERPRNVEWVRWVEYEQLGDEYRAAACALGVFGTSAKAARVIPNKVYQALACGTPLVTADTPAARELLVDDESARLVPAGNAEALADAVRGLLADDEAARRLADGGMTTYRAQASESVLAPRWREVVERIAR